MAFVSEDCARKTNSGEGWHIYWLDGIMRSTLESDVVRLTEHIVVIGKAA